MKVFESFLFMILPRTWPPTTFIAAISETVRAGRIRIRGVRGARAGATQRGRPRPVNDTWVAACCLAYGLPLRDPRTPGDHL